MQTLPQDTMQNMHWCTLIFAAIKEAHFPAYMFVQICSINWKETLHTEDAASRRYTINYWMAANPEAVPTLPSDDI